MKKAVFVIGCIITSAALAGQPSIQLEQTRIMTLGVFHFSYPNLDAVKTAEEDKINVLEDPWQSEIVAIAKSH